MALASGVPSGALRCISPGSLPLAPPSAMKGTRRWLCRLPSPMGEPYAMSVLSSRLSSPSVAASSFSSRYGRRLTWYLLIL